MLDWLKKLFGGRAEKPAEEPRAPARSRSHGARIPPSIEHDYRESLCKLREWAARQPDSIKACFDIVASPDDFQRLWSAYQETVPNTEEDRRGREMARKLGMPFEDLTPDLLIGNVYDVLRNRDNKRLPTNLEEWVDATVMEYRKNARASGLI